MVSLPEYFPTTTEISLFTGKVEVFNASSTMTSYELHYYNLPFLVWFAIAIPTLFFFSRVIKELIKRYG